MAEFLLEVGTEEIPARMLRKAEQDLSTALAALFKNAMLAHDPIEVHAAPRQLTAFSRKVATAQADRNDTIMGPPVRIAYDADGQPTKALQGFLRKNPALTIDDLAEVEQKKGAVLAGTVHIEGRATRDILAEALPGILDGLHFAKNMRWGTNPARFVRPVRNIVALFDNDTIPFSYAGVTASEYSFGHRRAKRRTFAVSSINQYLTEKREQGILVRRSDREAMVREQLQRRLDEVGGQLVPDDGLLAEIIDLVEMPYVVLGSFDPKFLKIPREVLITSLRDHQKSFTVQNEQGELMPYFLSIANVWNDNKGLIREGNQWVLRARLYDAKFFWESDCEKSFEGLRERLKPLIFQTKIGSYFAKTARLETLARQWGTDLGLSETDRTALAFAARHCKNDLVSEMVFEFPELQGITGGLLLHARGERADVADAIYQHYLPYSMDGELPSTKLGAIVSVCDKLDTLVGCFAVGLIPTGAKDPYALRRAAQGIVRNLVEHQLPLSLDRMLDQAIEAYASAIDLPSDLRDNLAAFFADRIRYYLKRKGFEHDLVEAVLARDADRVDQTLKRAEAIARQQEKDSFRNLALNLKRMNNVIADEEDRLPAFRDDLLAEAPEKDLWARYQTLKPAIEAAATQRDYNTAMDRMNELAEPVETYFGTDGVFINTDDDALRLNRKAMLHQIRLTLGLVADISCLESK